MANRKQEQIKTLAQIDAAIAMTSKVMAMLNMLNNLQSFSFQVSVNPMEYLLQILTKFIGKDELVAWLAKFLDWVVPVLEIGVKTILLTNLKHMISCSIDPRIPPYMRLGTPDSSGITVSVDSIDFLGKLAISPLDPDRGRFYYFGVEGIEDIGRLVRAQDFDAFLWLVIHRAKFPNSGSFETVVNNPDYNIRTLAEPKRTSTPDPKCIFNAIEVSMKRRSDGFPVGPNTMAPGSTYTSSTYSAVGEETRCVAMCTDVSYLADGTPYTSRIVPISQNAVSLNWYADPTKYARNFLGNQPRLKKNDDWNYGKEKAIFNLQFLDENVQDDSADGETSLIGRKVRLKILPEPAMLNVRRVHLNREGELSFATSISTTGGVEAGALPGFLKMTDEDEAHKNAYACYNGLTVYEFNYDYVMSLKLFDAKTLAVNLIESLARADIGVTFGLDFQRIEAMERVKAIVKRLVEQSDEVEDDCFYTFDNSKYDALIRQTAERKARQYTFGNTSNTSTADLSSVRDLLSEYETTTDFHSKTKLLEQAFTMTTTQMTAGMDEGSRLSVSFGLTKGLIENLTLAIIEALLTPKVMLLFEVNQQLMGGSWEKINFEEVLESMSGLIVSIVKEVADLIRQELLKLVLSFLEPILTMMHSMVLKEAIEEYISVIRNLLENCPFLWFKFGAQLVDTQLDAVDYADITVDGADEHERPQISNC